MINWTNIQNIKTQNAIIRKTTKFILKWEGLNTSPKKDSNGKQIHEHMFNIISH